MSGDKVEVVKVYQAGNAVLLLSQNEYILNDAGGIISVDVKSNVDYGVQMPDVDWISDEPSSRGMSSHNLKYVVAPNEDYNSRSAKIIFYDKFSDLKDTITVYQHGVLFETSYIDLQFDLPNVKTSYSADDGTLTMTYPSGNLPEVKVGNTIVLPAEYGFEIRVIENVSTSGKTLKLATSQGNMCNLFRNISFTLTTNPSVTSRSSSGYNVYTPSAYGYIDKDGKYHELYNEKKYSRSAQSMEKSLWDFNVNFSGDKIYNGPAGSLSWDICEFYGGLKGSFTFEFGEKLLGMNLFFGELKKFNCELSGNVGMNLKLKYDYISTFKASHDEIIKKNAINKKVIKFTVGAVPVIIIVKTDLGKQYDCVIEGKFAASAGVKLDSELGIGLEWTGGNSFEPKRKATSFFGTYPLTIDAQASSYSKISYYPHVKINLYNFVGPWFETRPYLKGNVGAGLTASEYGNYIGWQAQINSGMDLRMGLSVGWGSNSSYNMSSDLYNCIGDRNLFTAPFRITAISPENNKIVESGDSLTAQFRVESYSPITNNYYPCPNALVKLEPECGDLDKPILVADKDGIIKVKWIPCPNNESNSPELIDRTLTAKLTNKDNSLIDEEAITIKIKKKKDD